MRIIKIKTLINAPILRVFNLARSIDLHSISTAETKEKAISGRVAGLIELNDTVTWEACHFGIKQQLQSKITALDVPNYFRDEMLQGAFKSIYHEHFFSYENNQTLMIDVFKYEVPYGWIGAAFDYLVLNKYMATFLQKRNNIIKQYAETAAWKTILKENQ